MFVKLITGQFTSDMTWLISQRGCLQNFPVSAVQQPGWQPRQVLGCQGCHFGCHPTCQLNPKGPIHFYSVWYLTLE